MKKKSIIQLKTLIIRNSVNFGFKVIIEDQNYFKNLVYQNVLNIFYGVVLKKTSYVAYMHSTIAKYFKTVKICVFQ